MREWPHSIRWRLTLWYALVLSAMMAAFATGSWYLIRNVLATRSDQFLLDARDAFLVELESEVASLPDTIRALEGALRDVRFPDIEFVVLDTAMRIVTSSSTAMGEAPAVAGDGGRSPEPERVARQARSLRERAARGGAPDSRALATMNEEAGSRRGGERLALMPLQLGESQYILAAAQSRGWLRGTMSDVTTAYLTAIPVLLAFAVAGGYLLAARALAPIGEMGRRAREISAANLHERLPGADARDELGGLAGVINGLLERVEDAFARQRQLVADASHELRTPVAVVRAEAEVALSQRTRPEDEYRHALRVVRDASQRMSRMVDDLFLLARSDGRPTPIQREPLYLDELVEDTVRVLRTLAAQREVRLELDTVTDVPVSGDPELLARLLLNVIENAVKYSPPGSIVSVRLDRDSRAAQVVVADQGPGIPAEARARVFERFFRAVPASAGPGAPPPSGAGLGLAIARWVAEVHGGSLVLAHSSPWGSEFRVTLPLAEEVEVHPSEAHDRTGDEGENGAAKLVVGG